MSEDNDNDTPSFLNKKRKIMPTCQQCKLNESKYVCPRCQYKTCSVQCVKDHKKKFFCSGLRDKYKKVSQQKDYTEKAFYRDINYLSTTLSDINTSNKKVFNLLETTSIPQEDDRRLRSKTQKNFKRILKKFRGITLHKCPEHLQRAKENKSHLDSTTRKIYWTVKFTFGDSPQSEVLFDKREFDDEVTSIMDVIEYLNSHKDEVSHGEVLRRINEINWESKYNVFLRHQRKASDNNMETANDDKLYTKPPCDILCNAALKLKEVLKDRDIYEYPEFSFQLKPEPTHTPHQE